MASQRDYLTSIRALGIGVTRTGAGTYKLECGYETTEGLTALAVARAEAIKRAKEKSNGRVCY